MKDGIVNTTKLVAVVLLKEPASVTLAGKSIFGKCR